MPKRDPKQITRSFLLISLFVLIGGYALWQSRDVLFGIKLSVQGISDNSSFTTPIINISGKARHAVKVAVNESVIPVSEDGKYTTTIALLPGYNIISVSATDKFGKTITKVFRSYYTAPETPEEPETLQTDDTDTGPNDDSMTPEDAVQ